MELLFNEELGLVLEVSQPDVETVCQRYSDAGLQCHRIGRTCGFGPEAMVRLYTTSTTAGLPEAVSFDLIHASSSRSAFVWMDSKC